ncbi:MAG: thiamine diphosphokinase [Phoenicibacter congonensis]|uniref:Thiamine diphosphokinase n=1 Tax=Phoenicibacter congonensis TaxID=1944646 RepID=A0AA43UBF3_9ACTN|nr:thiamine diphosphokinase [Phoenicibacter congonensis]
MNTAVIVCSSDFNERAFRSMDEKGLFDYVMAVDGGYAHLERIGRRADIVLGDFDSLGWEPKGIHAVKFPVEKDDSDFQLTMTRLLAYSYDRVYVFGALGRRLDHTLSNLRIGGSAARRGLQVVFVGMDETVFLLKGGKAWEADVLEEDAEACDNNSSSPLCSDAESDDNNSSSPLCSDEEGDENNSSSPLCSDDNVASDQAVLAEKIKTTTENGEPALRVTRNGYEVAPGTTVSVMHLDGQVEGLFIRGLKWESDDAKVTEHPSLGLSNETTDEPILICIDDGTIAIVVNSSIC